MPADRDQATTYYEGINRQEVWKAAETDVPALLAYLAPLAPRPEP